MRPYSLLDNKIHKYLKNDLLSCAFRVIYIHAEGDKPQWKAYESGEFTMTRFEKDCHEMLKGAGRYILEGRMEEIRKLEKEQRACKNRFRLQCICQTISRLEQEYEALEELY